MNRCSVNCRGSWYAEPFDFGSAYQETPAGDSLTVSFRRNPPPSSAAERTRVRLRRFRRPSARSGDIFGNGQVLVVRTSKSRADPLGQLVGTKQTLGLDHLAFAVNPLGLDRVEPRALLGQQTTDDPHSRTAAALFDLSVVSSDPATYLPAYVPARVIPDQHQHLLAQPFELLRAPPLKEARGYGAYGSPFHETQPRLRQLWHIKPVARDGLRIGVILFERLLHQTQRLSSFAEAVPKVGWATLLHQHSSSKPTTQSILSSASLISRSRLLFFSHTRGRER